MFNVYLKSGEKRWVNRREARSLQRKGQLVCVLEIRTDEPESEGLYFCSVKNDFCTAPGSLQD